MDSVNYYIENNYQNSEIVGTNKILDMCKYKLYYCHGQQKYYFLIVLALSKIYSFNL